MFCTNCGSQIPDNSNACPSCGQNFVYNNQQYDQTNANEQYVNQQYTEQQYANQQYAEQQYANQQYAEQQYANQQYAEQQYANQQYANQQYTEQQYVSQQYTEQTYVEKSDMNQQNSDVNSDDVKKIFSEPDEEYVTSLGKKYLQKYLAKGSLGKAFCAVSDKKAYFYGTTYNVSTSNSGKKKAKKYKNPRTIDLHEVVGISLEKITKIVSLIIAYFLLVITTVIAAIPLTAGIVVLDVDGYIGLLLLIIAVPVILVFGLILFFIIKWINASKKKVLVVIQYANGEIGLDSSLFSKDEIESFQSELIVAKENAVEKYNELMANQVQNTNQTNETVNNANQNTIADELAKYADLLSKGVISEEEFATIKQQLLSKI